MGTLKQGVDVVDKVGNYIQIICGIIGMIVFVLLIANATHIEPEQIGMRIVLMILGVIGVMGSYLLIHFGISAIRRKDRNE